MKRILWIGCHKLLVKTELLALRELGFEVYRPTYLSEIYDQSAILEPDSNPSSLPLEILEKLNSTNFFYNSISDEITKVINQYFDACVVTISPNWLKNLAEAFQGKLIYRTYGQPYSLSVEFETIGLTRELLNRDNFIFLPHSLKSLESEHAWLKSRAKEVPYWIEDDVYKLENSWSLGTAERAIGLLCPNVDNNYYKDHYKYLEKNFDQDFYRIFGVQRKKQVESWFMGTLDRKKLLEEFQALSGFQYTYYEKNTCYLPPIEAAVIGVPILYPKGSLLSKYIGAEGPGEWEDEEQANILAERLLNKEMSFIEEIIAAQSVLKDLYRKEKCLPIFKSVFESVMNQQVIDKELNNNQHIIVPFYFPGKVIFFNGEIYSSAEGIPRVLKFYIDTLLNEGYKVSILVEDYQLADTWGYFNKDRKNNRALVISIRANNMLPKLITGVTKPIKQIAMKMPEPLQNRIYSSWRNFKAKFSSQIEKEIFHRISSTSRKTVALFPHYYHFRSLHNLDTNVSIVLYLPDYIPYLFPSNFQLEIDKYEDVGKEISERATLVITNSMATYRYLPETGLAIEPSKIRVFPLPRLGGVNTPHPIPSLSDKPFFFYPTQFRPNKRIDLLFEAFESISVGRDIHLVLTGNLSSMPDLRKRFDQLSNECKEKVFFVGLVSESEIDWLYENCQAVVVSSESEGNFPTQLSEAIYFGKPFIASNMEVVLEGLDGIETSNLFENGSGKDLFAKMENLINNLSSEQLKAQEFGQNFSEMRLTMAKSGILGVMNEVFNGK